MEAEQVVEKILSEARKEAQAIDGQSQQQLVHEQQKLEHELQEHKQQSTSLAEKAAKDKKEHLLSATRMDIAKQMLAEKRKILNEVFETARKQFKELSDQEYIEIILKLMLVAVETGDEEIVIDSDESRINHKLVKEINRKLGTGYKGNLKLSEQKGNIEAGFILKRGKIKNNVSLDVLISQAKNELEIELAKILFAN
ncbi:MAG: V-type ATP synthase subunit E [Planctomycetota bacterium]|jgi:V/A-type H+-transporting ATPase subunit E